MQSEDEVGATQPVWHSAGQAFAESSCTGTAARGRVQTQLKEMPVDVLGKDCKLPCTWACWEGGTKSSLRGIFSQE